LKIETKTLAKRAARADRRHAHRATLRRDGLALRLAGRASELADQPPLIALSIATLAGGLALRHGAVARAGARMLASHLLATGAKTVLKGAINRTRPARAVKEGHRLEKGDGADDSSLNSFPSGHTAGAVAVAEAIAAELPRAALPARLAAAGVGLVQPHRGKHYLSDVAAGAMIGWVAARAVDAAWRVGAARVRKLA
jgi:undecaprenyl-diphosphatase